MRILYASEGFGGGVFEIVRVTAEGVAQAGVEVAIAYGRRPETPGDVRGAIKNAVELYPLPWVERTLSTQLRAGKALRALVREWRPDLVHLYSAYAGVVGAAVLPRSVPSIFTPQAFAFTIEDASRLARRAYRAGEMCACRRATLVGACSHYEAGLARQLSPRTPVEVVPNGIPELEGVVGRRDLRPATPRVVAGGRPVPQRRPEACARILGSVAPRAEVAWIGGGANERLDGAGLRALREAGVPVTGWLPRGAAVDELSRASIYLHWTAWDGLPLSVLEAMALDVVVVASDIPPNREVLGPDQVCGDEAEAASMIRAALEDDRYRATLIASQRRRRRAYTARGMVEKWLQIYALYACRE